MPTRAAIDTQRSHGRGSGLAFIIGRDFVGRDRVAPALGDNPFYGAHFSDTRAAARELGATVSYQVRDRNATVVEFDRTVARSVSRRSRRNRNPRTR
jgi:glucose-1-phosphate thymidylyltransferase